MGLHSIIGDACHRWTKLRESLTELLRKAQEHPDAELARVSHASRCNSLEYVPPMGALSALLEELDLKDATFQSTMFDGSKKVADGHRDSSVAEALLAKAVQISQLSASIAWSEEMEAVIGATQVCIPLEKVTRSRISHRVHQIDQLFPASLDAGLLELQQHLDTNTEESWKQIVKVVEDTQHPGQLQSLETLGRGGVSHAERRGTVQK